MTQQGKTTPVGPRGLAAVSNSVQFPPISAQLVETLERLYPLAPPHPDMSDRQIWMDVGRQEIITVLRNRVRTQPATAGALTEVNVSEV